jgi:hypothetical protein
MTRLSFVGEVGKLGGGMWLGSVDQLVSSGGAVPYENKDIGATNHYFTGGITFFLLFFDML